MISATGIPDELRRAAQWVVWRYEERDGKRTKAPYDACEPTRRASSTDPATWASLTYAVKAVERGAADGIGFVFSPDDPFCGVDLDGCISDGQLHPEVQRLVERLHSYTEVSPSGNGIHIIIRASLNGGRKRTGGTPWGGEFETYDRERFFCFTANHVEASPATVENRQAELDAVRAEILPPEPKRVPAPAGRGVTGDDRDLLQRARAAKNGAKFEALWRGDTSGHDSNDSAADLALCNLLAFWTGPDPARIDGLFRQSGLMRDKWDSRRGDTTYGAITVASAISSQRKFYDPERRTNEHVTLDDQASGDPSEADSAVEERPSGDVFRLLTYEELRALPDPEWTIDGLVPEGFAVIYGAPATFKSFLALDWALCIGTGRSWNGRKVKPGYVVYVAAEGHGGLKRRVEAWREANGRPDLSRVRFLPEAVNLLDRQQIERTKRTLATLPEPARLLVVDTMARTMVGGDENAARDVGLFIAALDAQDVTTRLAVHHTGKDGGSERGSTALRAAADVMAKVERDGITTPRVEVACDKPPKDSEAWPRMTLKLEPVRSSCVLVPQSLVEGQQSTYEQRREQVLRFVEDHGPVSRNKVEEGVGGKAATTREAVVALVNEGLLEESRKGQAKLLSIPRPSLGDEVGRGTPQAPPTNLVPGGEHTPLGVPPRDEGSVSLVPSTVDEVANGGQS
jgi:hypothetical protein